MSIIIWPPVVFWIDKWWKGSPRTVRKIISNKVDLLDIHIFHQIKTTFRRMFPPSSESIIQYKKINIEYTAEMSDEKKWISNKSTLFETIFFFTILGLPFHHFSIKISISPSLSVEDISSKVVFFFQFPLSVLVGVEKIFLIFQLLIVLFGHS